MAILGQYAPCCSSRATGTAFKTTSPVLVGESLGELKVYFNLLHQNGNG
jgi:hypothetical protein